MNRHYKVFMLFAFLLMILFSFKLYNIKVDSQEIKALSIQSEAQALADFLIAFRSVYQDIFIKNHSENKQEVNKDNIDFLPVKTTNAISKLFSSLNTTSEIRTVSDRPRNPQNKANARQEKVIKFFRTHDGEKAFFQKYEDINYYSVPLYITPSCLSCHGKKEDAPLLIQERYNKAYDYKLGELRGIIDIEIKKTRLSISVDAHHTKHILFIIVFWFLLIVIFFLYAKSNKKLAEVLHKKDVALLEQELTQKKYLDTVIESSNHAIIAINREHEISTYNRKAQEIFGYSKEEMREKNAFFKIIPSKFHRLYKKQSKYYFSLNSLQSDFHTALSLKAKRKDGVIIPISVSLGMNIQQDKTIIVLNISDLSKEEKSKRDLQKSIQLFGENVIASRAGTDGKIMYASQAFSDISGYSIEELMGKSHNMLRHKDMSKKVFEDLWKTILNKNTWEGEIKNKTKSGGYYWVKATIIPILDTHGEIEYYESIRHDITARKVKEEFMANMSHELRTPLNAIIGFSSILSKQIKDPIKNNLSKQINYSSLSLLNLINDILDLSKIKNASFTIEKYPFNAHKTLSLCVANLQGMMMEKELSFEIEIDKSLDTMFVGDTFRISQVILNLISNAMKFTAKQGDIGYRAKYENNSLHITISDTGIGMSEEVQNKIFKAFEQADGSTTRKYGGTGLGLSISHELVERMQGTINLQSKENEGTTFEIIIPLEKEEKELEKEKEKEKKDSKALSKIRFNHHVLIVDDFQTNQMILKLFLGEFGISCDIASDGEEALLMYDPQKYSLVLMDESMPKMNGSEAMLKIREKYQERCTPIIVVTANAMEGEKERFLKLGMDAYLSKPINEEKLYTVLRQFLS